MFNSKRIADLEFQIAILRSRLDEVRGAIAKPADVSRCLFWIGGAPDAVLMRTNDVDSRVTRLMDYLGVYERHTEAAITIIKEKKA